MIKKKLAHFSAKTQSRKTNIDHVLVCIYEVQKRFFLIFKASSRGIWSKTMAHFSRTIQSEKTNINHVLVCILEIQKPFLHFSKPLLGKYGLKKTKRSIFHQKFKVKKKSIMSYSVFMKSRTVFIFIKGLSRGIQ